MKIIHTSDWHIGQDFYRYDRGEEHAAFFQQLCAIIKKEKPDALLVSGDVYHTALPSAAAQKLYTENMVRLHNACPEMEIVVTAGNHDSYTRLESAGKLWALANVKVIGNVEKSESKAAIKERHIKEIYDSNGKLIGYIIAIPYIREQDLAIFNTAQEIVKEMNLANLPAIMMGHLAISGANMEGHDEIARGGMDYISLNQFESYYDYWALGHIHCPQYIKGNKKIRYSGSPIQVNFDENYPHSVTLVEINKHNEEAKIKEIKIENDFKFLTIPSEPVAFNEALEALQKSDIPDKSYVCLNVKVKDYLPSDAEAQILNIWKGKESRFCKIKITKEAAKEDGIHQNLNAEEIKNMEPVDLANLYFQETIGEEMEEELSRMIKDITQTVREKERI